MKLKGCWGDPLTRVGEMPQQSAGSRWPPGLAGGAAGRQEVAASPDGQAASGPYNLEPLMLPRSELLPGPRWEPLPPGQTGSLSSNQYVLLKGPGDIKALNLNISKECSHLARRSSTEWGPVLCRTPAVPHLILLLLRTGFSSPHHVASTANGLTRDPGAAKWASPVQAANCAVWIQDSVAASPLGPGHPFTVFVVPMGSSHGGH